MIYRSTVVCATAVLLGFVSMSARAQEAPVPQPAPVPQAAPIPQPAPEAQVQPLPAPASSEQAVRTTYRLGPDDQIMIQVADVPDISGKPQRVDPEWRSEAADGWPCARRRSDDRAARG